MLLKWSYAESYFTAWNDSIFKVEVIKSDYQREIQWRSQVK